MPSGWNRYKNAHPERQALYRDPRWRSRRQAQLAEHPRCVVCGRPATDADHVTAIALGGSPDGPLQSMCRRCHLRKTAEDAKAALRGAARRKGKQR